MGSAAEDPRDELRRAILADEALIAQVLALRKSKEHWWTSSALISGLVAVITVALTGTATYVTQRDAKGREFQLAQQQVLFAQRRDITSGLADLVAHVEKATEDRLLFARGEYDSLPAAEKRALLDSSNVVDDRWHIASRTNGVLLRVYFGDDSRTAQAWDDARTALQRYVDCTEATYEKYLRRPAPADACAADATVAHAALNRFWSSLGTATMPAEVASR